MYKVRNGTGGSLPLQLEKGAIILQAGKTFDLDGVCSREFIRNSHEIKTLLEGSHLLLIHDSEQGVPPQPTWDVMKKANRKPKANPKPVVVDFSNIPDPEKELPLEVLAKKPKKPKAKRTKKVKKSKIEVKEKEVVEVKEGVEEIPPSEMYECPQCGREFTSARGLMSHSRVHK